MQDSLANKVLQLRHDCVAENGRLVIIHAGAIPITARGLLSYSYESGMFTINMTAENAIGEFSPNYITQIDGMEIWVD